MTNPHDAFKALAPVDWSTINQDDLSGFLTDVLVDAQCLIDSIPVSLNPKGGASHASSSSGRPRSATDPPKLPTRAPKTSDRAEQLRKEWKEVQVNPRDNSLGVNVYKLSAKDKKGAWFARRSVHEGLTFEKWKLGMETEFAESLKVQGQPGEGKIRGIGADQRVVNTFPGPTTPRDFVTLLLSSDSALETPMQEGLGKPKYFMLVSKPCIHPECPQRSGYIRGQYESVEFIREIKVEKPLRKVHSSIDLGNEEAAAARQNAAQSLGKETMIRSARSAAMSSSVSDSGDSEGRKRGRTIAFAGSGEDEKDDDDDDNVETMVEWLMVTRSDPGGSVPRFMVEKGTPAGIAGDAEKFLKWISSKKTEEIGESDRVDSQLKQDASQADSHQASKGRATADPTSNIITNPGAKPSQAIRAEAEEEPPRPGGFYGMIAEALGAVASRLPNPLGSAKGGDTESDLSSMDEDDTSSVGSFHSLESDHEGDDNLSKTASNDVMTPAISNSKDGEGQSTHSSESAGGKSVSLTQHEKELRKLEDRRRKLAEKMARAQERAVSKKDADSQRDEAAIAKLREKHDREVQKQEEKYQRELKRLEDKRLHEQRKAEDRKRKQAEREEKANLAMELDKTRAERDVALKQVEVLKAQIGELQGQNTMLVAKLGKQSSPALLADLRRTDSFKSTGAGAGV
ncbi:hypothetical protein JX265_009577 [Neoarthrinium moseri]|uniref:DUF3074 domain-containing protein n=1 Tax=Neoarthrinium moseri TaxID=1658444 RepID=A0A9Q0AJ85_9PEZI|nr:hypothetical protein JX265_009577 [Neoarthrinium moseri]